MTIEELKNMSLEIVNKAEAEQRDLSEDENKTLEENKAKIAELRAMEDDKKEEKVDTPVKEGESEDKTSEDIPSESGKTEEEKSEDKPEDKEEKTDNKKSERNLNKLELKKDIHMEKRNFSLLRSIRSVVNHEKFNEIDEAVINAVKAENRGFGNDAQIMIPMEERAAITVSNDGDDVVATDVMAVLPALRAGSLWDKLGIKTLTGLKDNVKYPIYNGGNAFFEGENDEAQDGAGSFSSVDLSPKRISAYLTISNSFLLQDNANAENVIREDLVAALRQKIDETIFGDATVTGDAKSFASVIATVGDATGSVATFADLTEAEAEVDDSNGGELKYASDNHFKAFARALSYAGKSTRMVMENGNIDGTELHSSSLVAKDHAIIGDWNQAVLASWGNGLQLIVDPYTRAKYNETVIIGTIFADFKVLRPECFKVVKK